MATGFFTPTTLHTARTPAYSVPRCGKCGLLKTCQTPKMPVWGKGQRRVLIVGEAPGKYEDEQGRLFVGRAGQKLAAVLDSLGINLHRDCWVTNSLACRPPGNKIDDIRKIDYCRPLVNAAIRELQPAVIIPLGRHAVRSILAPLWKDDPGEIGKWVGWQIPLYYPDVWVCPTWHPSYLLRQNDQVLDLWFTKHLKRAFRLQGTPWGGQPPDPTAGIEIYHDPDAAAKRIWGMLLLGDFPAAFDYETTCLKPDSPEAEIVCCAICWEGKTTIAYPWGGAAINATRAFLRSPAPKRGFNIKFESRWSYAKLGVWPRNWEWDGMLAAHTADNRPGITGLKFQAFVRLGQPIYNAYIEPYLQSTGGANAPNRIRQIDPTQLLTYCAQDALLEWKVSELQRKELGYGD